MYIIPIYVYTRKWCLLPVSFILMLYIIFRPSSSRAKRMFFSSGSPEKNNNNNGNNDSKISYLSSKRGIPSCVYKIIVIIYSNKLCICVYIYIWCINNQKVNITNLYVVAVMRNITPIIILLYLRFRFYCSHKVRPCSNRLYFSSTKRFMHIVYFKT